MSWWGFAYSRVRTTPPPVVAIHGGGEDAARTARAVSGPRRPVVMAACVLLMVVAVWVTTRMMVPPTPSSSSSSPPPQQERQGQDQEQQLPEQESNEEFDSNADSTGGLSKRNAALLVRGMPLVDAWQPAEYQLSNNSLNALLDALGDTRPCNNATENVHVRAHFSVSGFGSNMFNLLNAALFARSSNRKMVIVDTDHWHELQWVYQRDFAYPEKGDTVCPEGTIESEARPPSCKYCRTFQMFRSYIASLKRQREPYYLGATIALFRLFTRLRPEMRREVDAVVDKTLSQRTTRGEGKPGIWMAIHVRGTDKLDKEAQAVSPEQWRFALRAASAHRPRVDTVVVVTDDAKYARRVLAALQNGTTSPFKQTQFLMRTTNIRPDDSTSEDGTAHASAVQMMADLKLMNLADVFVGSGSSNYGSLACYLRGSRACFDVENSGAQSSTNAFKWVHSRIHVMG